MLNVYKASPSIAYSGGCIIVVAHNENEAYNILGDYTKTYVDKKNIKRIKELNTTLTEPKVIINSIYIE